VTSQSEEHIRDHAGPVNVHGALSVPIAAYATRRAGRRRKDLTGTTGIAPPARYNGLLPGRRISPQRLAGLPRNARVWAAAVIAGLTLASMAAVTALPHGSAVPSLLTEGIAQDPCHSQDVLAVPPGVRGQYIPGSSVLYSRGAAYVAPGRFVPVTAAEDACIHDTVRGSQRWLYSGTIPGDSPQLRAMAIRALLDLRLSTQPDGAVAAGWRPYWRYSWPRDSSWAAVALADTGHRADAFHILQFFQRTQLADGGWAARYWTDGSGPVRDGRPAELDAVGWVPWAVWSWGAAQPQGNRVVRRQLAGLWPMVSAAADAAVRSLSADGLPSASMDYWENSVQVTLGTAAALLVGLHAAVALAGEFGVAGQAVIWAEAGARLSAGIRAAFGHHGYHRLPYVASGADAAVTFLGPPFEPLGSALRWAVLSAQRALTLKPGGGLLPGTSWPGNKTVAWTAETAFFALFWASAGDRAQSAGILSWLAAHRTGLGALPEQVTGSGRQVSVAPLAWTDAVVLLALLAQGHRLPVPGGPAA